jgi:hypothetical protein
VLLLTVSLRTGGAGAGAGGEKRGEGGRRQRLHAIEGGEEMGGTGAGTDHMGVGVGGVGGAVEVVDVARPLTAAAAPYNEREEGEEGEDGEEEDAQHGLVAASLLHQHR